MRKVILLVLMMMFLWMETAMAEQIEKAMVKIFSIKSNPDYINPWNLNQPKMVSGSGCIIAGDRILTNAHVVSNQTFIQVRAYGDSRKYDARVLYVSHNADLAILTTKDPTFFDGKPTLGIGELPRIQQPVAVYGFPEGGDTLSITAGVVSRVEHSWYGHSYQRLLAIQVDAAVNDGNSGGPVLADGNIIGVAMQSLDDADNISYLVPPPTISQFLTDIADGRLDGIPTLGIRVQGMGNPAIKKRHQLEPIQTGVLVNHVVPGASADGILHENDILLAVDGHMIADDETVVFRPQERTRYTYPIENKQIGDTVTLSLVRKGKINEVQLPLTARLGSDQLLLMEYDVKPRFYVFGGLVFSPLSINYFSGWGSNWSTNAPSALLSYLGQNWQRVADEEVVLMTNVLPNEINVGYHDLSDEIITGLNGTPIYRLQQMIAIIEAAPDDAFLSFETKKKRRIIIRKSEARKKNAEILARYRISADRSE